MNTPARVDLEVSISFTDWPDDLAVYGAFIVYLPGCSNTCVGCHNLALKTPQEYDEESLVDKILELEATNPVRHLILSGGDPLSVYNKKFTNVLLRLFPNLSKTVYTGHDESYIKSSGIQGFCEYVKSGPYLEDLSQKSGHYGNEFWLASKNQKLLDGKTLEVLSSEGIFFKNKRGLNVQ